MRSQPYVGRTVSTLAAAGALAAGVSLAVAGRPSSSHQLTAASTGPLSTLVVRSHGFHPGGSGGGTGGGTSTTPTPTPGPGTPKDATATNASSRPRWLVVKCKAGERAVSGGYFGRSGKGFRIP